MNWFTSLIVLAIVVLLTWLAISYQASLSENSSHEHHEADHSTHDDHSTQQDHHAEVEALNTLAPVEPLHSPVPEPAPEPASAAVMAAPSETLETKHAEEPILEPVKPDDLVIIEGIGPKISGVLQSAGIQTFSQLAGLDAEKIKEILGAADARLARIADPTSWPAQAKMAAAGEFDALKAFQDQLKGGRN